MSQTHLRSSNILSSLMLYEQSQNLYNDNEGLHHLMLSYLAVTMATGFVAVYTMSVVRSI